MAAELQQIGSPRALYEQPATAFVAGFIGETNFWDCTLAQPVAAGAEAAIVTLQRRRRGARNALPARCQPGRRAWPSVPSGSGSGVPGLPGRGAGSHLRRYRHDPDPSHRPAPICASGRVPADASMPQPDTPVAFTWFAA